MEYKVEEHFCIYIDILGFSKSIEEKMMNVLELEREFQKFISSTLLENESLKKLIKHLSCKIKFFSDNILISLPVSKDGINTLNLILSHIIDYQKSLIKDNYFIRGSIVKDLLYIDKQIIWGPALIKAVKLEKDTEYPFISFSKEILKLWEKHDLVKNIDDSKSIPIIEIIEGKYFLDYLKTIIFRGESNYSYEFLDVHKKLIEHHLSIEENRIFKKYYLLANYHNEFCRCYIEKFPQMQRYIIKDFFNHNIFYKRKFLRYNNEN